MFIQAVHLILFTKLLLAMWRLFEKKKNGKNPGGYKVTNVALLYNCNLSSALLNSLRFRNYHVSPLILKLPFTVSSFDIKKKIITFLVRDLI